MLKQRALRYALGLVLTIIFVFHASDRYRIHFLDTLENQAYDFRLKLSLPEHVDKKVIIIDIDEKSLGEIGHWPWERSVLAKIVDNLFDYYHINSLGFDIVFSEQDIDAADQILIELAQSPLRNQPEFQNIYSKAQPRLNRDETFARSLENRNTILGIVFDSFDATLQKGDLPKPLPHFNQSIIDSFNFNHAQGYAANLPILQQHALGGGFFTNPQLDDDGVFRRVPLLQEYNGQMYPSLALALARTSLDENTLKIGYSVLDEASGLKSLEWIYLGGLAIPVDSHGGVLVPYIGYYRSFDYIPAVDILNKTLPVDAIEGKIALFGTSAAGLLDLRTTPLQSAYPGVEVHANIIQGILDQTIMHKPQYIMGFEILMVIILGLSLTMLLPMLSPLWSSAASVLAIATILGMDVYAWHSLQIVLPITASLLLVVLLYVLNMTLGFFIESRGKRHLTQLFGQYVPPELVEEMSRNEEAINLDGEIRDMTVLFTDVRGFTTISENMEPQELTRFINAFLTPLTRIIHTNRGTIDKYMGDAIMAFWGAPLEDNQHARHALNAAMEMIAELPKLNATFKQQGRPEIHIGVGVNTGPMNVGNKGSDFRVDYTVLGDNVNLGSRLEGLTKTYGVDIIVGPSTRHAVPEFEYRELDLVRVKGKDKPVNLFEPVGLVDHVDKVVRSQIKKFDHALQLYRAQKWDDAEQEIFQLSQTDPGHKKLYDLYLDRIAHFRKDPPSTTWDGVFTHTSK